MKTLAKSNGIKKLAKLYNGSKSSTDYQIVKDLLSENPKRVFGKSYNLIRPCYTSGSGRFTSNQDHTKSTCKLLSLIGIEYVLTNDAPRGSATGNLITITTKIN